MPAKAALATNGTPAKTVGVPGGRYFQNGKYVDCNGEPLDPEEVRAKLTNQINDLQEKLNALSTE